MSEIDLSVRISNVELKNPLIVASGPPTLSEEHLVKCIKTGAAGAVTKTITYDPMQQVQPKPRMFIVRPEDALSKRFYSFYSIDLMSEYTPERWAEKIGRVRNEVERYGGVVIASIAGRTLEEWERLAKLLENAGAHMLELNLSCPHVEKGELMGRAVVSDRRKVSEIIKVVKGSTSLPVIGKLTPHGANPVELAVTMVSAGVDALVSTARFQGLILDLKTMRPILWGGFGGYGGPWQLPISIGWTARVAMEKLGVPIIGSGGASSWEDIVSFIIVGASAVQICTAIMINGLGIIPDMLSNIRKWMGDMGFHNLDCFVGAALKNILPLESLERRKLYSLQLDSEKCIKCGVCIRICPYDALSLDESKKIPVLNQDMCDNCGLCMSICPVKSITLTKPDALS